MDAMPIPWTQGHCYAFPPFCLKPPCAKQSATAPTTHCNTDNTLLTNTGVVSASVGNAIRRPILIPSSTILLVNPKGNPHPLVLNKIIILIVWQFPGRDYLSRKFLRKQPSLFLSQEGKELYEITNRPEKSGLTGVTHGKLIHFDAL